MNTELFWIFCSMLIGWECLRMSARYIIRLARRIRADRERKRVDRYRDYRRRLREASRV